MIKRTPYDVMIAVKMGMDVSRVYRRHKLAVKALDIPECQ